VPAARQRGRETVVVWRRVRSWIDERHAHGSMLAPPRKRLSRTLKRVLDPVLALVLLVVLSPLLLALAAWILIDSGRPMLYSQRRAGKDGRPFQMHKFRTMVRDAVEVGRALALTPDPFGVVPNDPRITASGRFLRRTGLDELPQLLNVLRGEMSLVGPRPDLVEQVANYAEPDRRRLAVLPGITGWAQIQGRDEIPWTERFKLDAWYVDNWSLLLDLKIILRTWSQPFREEPAPLEDTLNIERARGSRESETAPAAPLPRR
jgi:lipopolysaccharide/colanic/teichoic acid biosynthesis glycosyltransferase